MPRRSLRRSESYRDAELVVVFRETRGVVLLEDKRSSLRCGPLEFENCPERDEIPGHPLSAGFSRSHAKLVAVRVEDVRRERRLEKPGAPRLAFNRERTRHGVSRSRPSDPNEIAFLKLVADILGVGSPSGGALGRIRFDDAKAEARAAFEI